MLFRSGMFGNGGAGKIEEGKVEGDKISFRAGDTTYTGVLKSDKIELRKSLPAMLRAFSSPPKASNTPRPAIGPPPDGTDPSIPSFGGGGGGNFALPPITLQRVKR